MELEKEMTYRLTVRGPLEPRDGSTQDPRRRYWEMSSATLQGPRINATSAMPGLDWFSPYDEGYGRPHVRLPFYTDDGALLLLEYHGVVHASEKFQRAVTTGGSTQWADQYMRMALVFDTSAARYQWLVRNLFIARGRLSGPTDIEYEVFRVC